MERVSIRYRVATQLERFLDRRRRWAARGVAFILGMFVNDASNTSTPLSTVRAVYSPHRISGYLAWGVTIGAVIMALGRPVLERYTRKWNWLGVLTRTFAEARDPALSWLDDSTLAWGTQIMLQSPADLREGWKSGDVELALSRSAFKLAERHRVAYRKFVEQQEGVDPQRIASRSPKYGITRNPRSFSDNPDLRLEIHETEYSKIIFFKDVVARDRAQLKAFTQAAITDNRIDFPNNLTLHAVVVTRDGRLLLTRRSPKVEYFPKSWSCSIEEQLAARDLEPEDGGAVARWVARTLVEELGFHRTTLEQWYDEDARILGVILEAAVPNCGLIGLIQLQCDSETLSQILRTHPRTDYEFDEFRFVEWSKVAGELVHPTRSYHPTTGIRMLMAGIAHYGPVAFMKRLVDARISATER